ncbi:MAG: SiaB family protein kinase [Geobacteraceae bacterium]|nr:SiaB family protein kinase [Geobacteraceae bacterium]
MRIINLYNLKETFNSEGILICFAGPFSHSIIEELGNAVKRYLEAEQMTKDTMMDVFSTFIEQTQNVRNYARQKTEEGNRDCDFNSGIVVIGKNGSNYEVSSGNVVERSDIQGALKMLDLLKDLDKQALKNLFKEQLRKIRPAGSSSGLGLIDMSRKASQPLGYTLRDMDDRYCFFSLKAII